MVNLSYWESDMVNGRLALEWDGEDACQYLPFLGRNKMSRGVLGEHEVFKQCYLSFIYHKPLLGVANKNLLTVGLWPVFSNIHSENPRRQSGEVSRNLGTGSGSM